MELLTNKLVNRYAAWAIEVYFSHGRYYIGFSEDYLDIEKLLADNGIITLLATDKEFEDFRANMSEREQTETMQSFISKL